MVVNAGSQEVGRPGPVQWFQPLVYTAIPQEGNIVTVHYNIAETAR